MIIAREEINSPNTVCGTISPDPTVVTVKTAQYIPRGMLVKPCCPPSTTYITVPSITIIASTVLRKILILTELAFKALPKTTASLVNLTYLKIRNTLSNLNILMMIRY
jgi:hypothetical protein